VIESCVLLREARGSQWLAEQYNIRVNLRGVILEPRGIVDGREVLPGASALVCSCAVLRGVMWGHWEGVVGRCDCVDVEDVVGRCGCDAGLRLSTGAQGMPWP
jgi:hypothetical protein